MCSGHSLGHMLGSARSLPNTVQVYSIRVGTTIRRHSRRTRPDPRWRGRSPRARGGVRQRAGSSTPGSGCTDASGDAGHTNTSRSTRWDTARVQGRDETHVRPPQDTGTGEVPRRHEPRRCRRPRPAARPSRQRARRRNVHDCECRRRPPDALRTTLRIRLGADAGRAARVSAEVRTNSRTPSRIVTNSSLANRNPVGPSRTRLYKLRSYPSRNQGSRCVSEESAERLAVAGQSDASRSGPGAPPNPRERCRSSRNRAGEGNLCADSEIEEARSART